MKSHYLYILIALFLETIQCHIYDGPIKATADYVATTNVVLDNILLIINYNHPYYESYNFLTNIYQKTCPHIVFYGEKTGKNIHAVTTHQGWFAQRVLADAMLRYPDYDGYLMVQDDCFINYWNLGRFDRSKIWSNEANPNNLLAPNYHWMWWTKECGLKALKKSLSQLDSCYIKQLHDNCGPNTAVTGAADFIYIPASYKESFLLLSTIFNDVFIEIALPTIVFCLEKRDNIEFTHFIWDYNGHNVLDRTLDWIHPLKFSQISNQERIKKYLKDNGQ